MYVDIVISNIFYLNKHFFFFFLKAGTLRRFHGCLYMKQAVWASTLAWHARKWPVQSFV